jgi:hypothetical protein
MTRMAGSNPKIAAIFGGGDFGLKNDAVNNAAFQDRSALQMAATNPQSMGQQRLGRRAQRRGSRVCLVD